MTVLCVVGPTASGKTKMAVALARWLNGEVVSVDSMQIYRGMTIGTAAPTAEEMEGVPHHMIAVADPAEQWSAARFCQAADACIQDILSRGKLPVLAGGTGLYLDALIRGDDFAPGCQGGQTRLRLQQELRELGPREMLRRLEAVDPETAARLHLRDEKRILRALEVYEETGEPMSRRDKRGREKPDRYQALYIGLNFRDRADLRERIDRRVDEMVRRGLLQEVQALLDGGLPRDATALQAIGYKQFLAVADGTATAEQAVEEVKLRPPICQAAADLAAAEPGDPLDLLGQGAGFPGGSPECDRFSHSPWLRIRAGGQPSAQREKEHSLCRKTTFRTSF